MRDDFFWTEANVNRLRLLWDDPKMTCAAIARELKTGKNSVISKVHRLNLKQRENPVKRAARAAVAVAPRVKAAPVAKSPDRPLKSRPPSPVRQLPQLTCAIERDASYRSDGAKPGCCKWPMWPHHVVGATGPFCNLRIRRADSPYCEGHRAVAYQER